MSLTSQSHLNIVHRIVWERAQSLSMCQAAVVCVALSADEFAGFGAGYLGEGEFICEPFHVCFRGEQATQLVIGDRSVLTGKAVLFEHWPKAVRLAVVAARQHLARSMVSDAEGFYIATPSETRRIRWSQVQTDEGLSEIGNLDARVWLRIPAQLGLTALITE